MARVKFGVAEDDKMFSFWEERLKMGDESAKDVYGFVLWEKYEPVNERSVSSLQSRARRIVPQFYQWNWKVGRKLAVYKMWQKSFTGDKATLHAIEKYCKVDITLYRDGTIKSWTRKSKSKPTMTSQEGGVAALKDAGSERIVIEDSDEEMQISEAVQPTKPNVTLCFSEDEVDEVVQPPKKKPKSTVSQPEIVQRVVAEPPKENAVVTAVDDAPGAVNPLDYTHVSLAELDTMNFTQIIESLKKTVNTNHETREFLGKPPISTPPHLKKSFNEITPLEPLMSGEKKKQNCVSFPNQPLFGNREELVQSKKADENDVGDRVVPAKQLNDVAPPRPETRTVSPPNTAPATCGRSPETIKVTPKIRNEAFSVAFKRLRECHKHITPENVPQFRAVERKIQADGLTLEQFCDKMAVDFVNLSALLMAETARSSTKVRLVPVPHLYVRAPQRLQIVTDIWNEFEKSTPTDKLPLIKNSIEGSELMILIMSLSEEQYADGMKDLAASLRQEFVYNSD